MAFSFPRPGTRAAELITPHVHECLAAPEKLPTRKEAAARAKNFFASTTSGANGLYVMTLLANDEVAMCFYGPRGGFRVAWTFGRAM